MLIVENDYVQHLEYAWRAFGTDFWNTSELGDHGIGLKYYRPLVTISYLVNYLMAGGSAWVFHLTNVLLHGGVVYLSVRIGQRWLKSTTLAIFAAAIFALHPTRAESVVWIAGRTDVLMALFALASVRSLQLALDSVSRQARSRWLS
ncbi:MAG TPA: hypothetical protein VG963_05590, partial [Polyangiaceae bacterium]|nr:hypothetical protein [Polyangiaceae bacterium]